MPSCSDWEEETEESVLEMRLLRNAVHKLYGPGTHWIETRDEIPAQDLVSRTPKRPLNTPTASTSGRMDDSVPERLQIAAPWRWKWI